MQAERVLAEHAGVSEELAMHRDGKDKFTFVARRDNTGYVYSRVFTWRSHALRMLVKMSRASFSLELVSCDGKLVPCNVVRASGRGLIRGGDNSCWMTEEATGVTLELEFAAPSKLETELETEPKLETELFDALNREDVRYQVLLDHAGVERLQVEVKCSEEGCEVQFDASRSRKSRLVSQVFEYDDVQWVLRMFDLGAPLGVVSIVPVCGSSDHFYRGSPRYESRVVKPRRFACVDTHFAFGSEKGKFCFNKL